MTSHIRKAVIVYCSPAGSTEHVARVINRKIQSLETPVTMIDLAREPDLPFIISQFLDAKDNICLYIGSPVYASHAAPPVMEFISHLPLAEKGYSVPFAAWGGVSSGIALYTMGKALEEKGYTVLGAAKVLARHSLMWASDMPLGMSRPDAGDDQVIEELVEKVQGKLKTDKPMRLSISLLAYQPREIHTQMEKKSLESAKSHFPKREVDEKRCTRCGLCVDQCPVGALNLSPFPEFGPSCLFCLNCVRLCPEGAIGVALSQLFDRLRAMAEQRHEQPPTQIFV